MAQFEREIIRDRTVAGLSAARARGRVGGRPSKLSVEQRRQARRMYDARELTVEQIGQVLGVSRTTIYRALGSKAFAAAAAAEAAPSLAAPTPTPTPASTLTLALEGLSASIGSVGDAYDNAAAETVFGLFKNEAVMTGSPFRTGPLRHLADVEALTLNYVHWYDNDRLHSKLDYLSPEEYEQAYYQRENASNDQAGVA